MKTKNKRIIIRLASFLLIISIFSGAALFIAYMYIKKDLNFSLDESLFQNVKRDTVTTFYYDSALGSGEYKAEKLCEISPSEDKRRWYPYEEMGDNIKLAFLCVEDRRFFEHHGVDIKRTGYAILNYFLKLKPKFGGSSITQQVIKNISGDDEQTPKRKIAEMIRATHIEYSHTKEEIFEVYLNIVPMGERISGIGFASEYYFNKKPSELSLSEAATLVGITNAPTKYNPNKFPEACVNKRNDVLYTMLQCGAISNEDYENSVSQKLYIAEQSNEEINSWFVETVCDDVAYDLSRKNGISENVARILILNGGLSIYTTVNPKIQKILEDEFNNANNFPSDITNGLEYSMVITDSKNGNLLGIVGGVGKKNANRILNYALENNPPGSVLKPLALYAPLINEKKINWATVFDDVPVTFIKNSSGELRAYPENSPRVYDGLINISDALCYSKNTVAIRLYEKLGKRRIFKSLKEDFGFDTLIEKKTLKDGRIITDLDAAPLALGQLSYGVSLRKLTEAYTVFPNEGVLSAGRSYIYVYDSDGKLLLENAESKKEIFSSETAAIMNQLLMKVTEVGTAKQITLDDIIDTGGKTGTSGNDENRFFVGFTPYFTSGIWCGYKNKNQSIGYQSISHIEIWDKIMKEIHDKTIDAEEIPKSFSTEGLECLPYCKDSGNLFCENCLYDVRESRLAFGYFTEDNKPSEICERHKLCYYDEITNAIACDKCPHENLKLIALIDVPDRSFPCEVIITDAEYIWRELNRETKPGNSYDVPYFINMLNEGEYSGRSKGKKQFNSFCYLHND